MKLFPIEPLGGVKYVQAVSGPYQEMAWTPTGGITPEGLPGYLQLKSVLACGGSWVAPRTDVAAGNFEAIAARAARAVEIVRGARESKEAYRYSDTCRRRNSNFDDLSADSTPFTAFSSAAWRQVPSFPFSVK